MLPAKIVLDIASNALLERGKRPGISCRTKASHIGLRERLVLTDERGGHVDELDIPRRTNRVANRICQIDVGTRHASSQIENTIDLRMLEQPEHHIHNVADPDKI